MKQFLLIIFSSLIIFSCSKNTSTGEDPATTGKIAITLSLPSAPAGGSLPTSYTVAVGDSKTTITQNGTLVLASDFDPGNYTIYVYNEVQNLNLANAIASLEASDGAISSLASNFYFGHSDTDVVVGDTSKVEVTLSMINQNIDFAFSITEGDAAIDNITSSISGIASGWDCASGKSYGNAANLVTALSINTLSQTASTKADPTDEYIITGEANYLGLAGDVDNILSIQITFTDSNLGTCYIDSDISDLLKEANSNGSSSITLNNSIELPTQSDFGDITISDWTYISNDTLQLK